MPRPKKRVRFFYPRSTASPHSRHLGRAEPCRAPGRAPLSPVAERQRPAARAPQAPQHRLQRRWLPPIRPREHPASEVPSRLQPALLLRGERREAGSERRAARRARSRPGPSLTAAPGAPMTARAGRAVAAATGSAREPPGAPRARRAPPPHRPPPNRCRRLSPAGPAPSARDGEERERGRVWDGPGPCRAPSAARSLPSARGHRGRENNKKKASRVQTGTGEDHKSVAVTGKAGSAWA